MNGTSEGVGDDRQGDSMIDAPPPVGVYLDSTALIDLSQALSPEWSPPPELIDEVDRRRVAIARLFFYAARIHPDDGRRRSLYCSGVGREELAAKTGDWTEAVLMDLDDSTDASPQAIEAEAQRFEAGGVGPNDARHLAIAALTPWIDLVVSDDRKFRRKAALLDLRADVHVVGAVEAVASLAIREGDPPQTGPAPGSPLHGRRWWVPGEGPALT
jgi:hypothetical protein